MKNQIVHTTFVILASTLMGCASQFRHPAGSDDTAGNGTNSVRLTGRSTSKTVEGQEIAVYLDPNEDVNCASQMRQISPKHFRCTLKSNVVGDVSHAALVSPENQFRVYQDFKKNENMTVICYADRIVIDVVAADLMSAQNVVVTQIKPNMDKLRVVVYVKGN